MRPALFMAVLWPACSAALAVAAETTGEVAKGEVTKYTFEGSRIFPGTAMTSHVVTRQIRVTSKHFLIATIRPTRSQAFRQTGELP
jgi:hypothetical protein